jgi:hypothetical protein
MNATSKPRVGRVPGVGRGAQGLPMGGPHRGLSAGYAERLSALSSSSART